MEKKLPLSLKLILPLIVMQFLAMTIGITWLSSWLEKSRFQELEHILDTQTDVIEDAVVLRDGKLQFDLSGELIDELNTDKNYYFAILTPDGLVVEETQGPSAAVRKRIREQLKTLKVGNESIDTAKVGDGEWRVLMETINMNMLYRKDKESIPMGQGERQIGSLYAAIDAGPLMLSLAFVKKAISVGALLLLLLITLGTAVIVSSMTSNLRKFVQSLEKVRPENPAWNPPSTPNSLEEIQLFTSFHAMISSIQKATESQRLFIANASHELKTPIAGMMMSLEVLLTKKRSPEEYEATAQKLLATVRSLRRLSTALLDFSRISNSTAIPLNQVDLTLVFDSLMARWAPYAEAKKIKMMWNFQENLPIVKTNQDLIEVALGNYIDNAIKYTSIGGNVEISVVLSSQHEKLWVAVKDDGIGMSERELSSLGQVFFRANEARSEGDSYGLGFAQANQIIHLLGCHLEVKSSLGVGTTVTVAIPLPIMNRV